MVATIEGRSAASSRCVPECRTHFRSPPESGVIENIGTPLPFEETYLAGYAVTPR
ncbi:hypothetical protein [Lentzea terrae]|uniref:hypothetical protein n=1 Tax=Lentzea terrae TaxID=2200761 RepID=UPI001E5FC53A|nr:hypothetical protein [Lentzea terrae]